MWPAVIAGGAALLSTALGVREARKNREWQERMSSTAHQREVLDMKMAGINPIMSARGGGASTPPGAMADFSELPKAAGTALMLKQAQANVDLTEANTAKTVAEKDFLRDSFQLRLREQGARTDIGELDAQKARDVLPFAIRQARAQLDLTTSSARGAKARAALDELDKARAMNARDLEEWLRGGTPGVRLLMEILRSVGAAGVGAALARKPTIVNRYK